MKTTLDFLPENKREQLALVVKIIVESVQPEKVILFGSYTRVNGLKINTWRGTLPGLFS